MDQKQAELNRNLAPMLKGRSSWTSSRTGENRRGRLSVRGHGPGTHFCKHATRITSAKGQIPPCRSSNDSL